eukprot:6472805-Amphidinium_carterae.1
MRCTQKNRCEKQVCESSGTSSDEIGRIHVYEVPLTTLTPCLPCTSAHLGFFWVVCGVIGAKFTFHLRITSER